jgi:RNA 2',3'-cyclic 3'-phosphodiesterase
MPTLRATNSYRSADESLVRSDKLVILNTYYPPASSPFPKSRSRFCELDSPSILNLYENSTGLVRFAKIAALMLQRLFIALDLPLEVRESLVALQPKLPDLRVVPVENLHLTLHFLGAADATVAAELMNQVAAYQQSFEFHLDGVGYFFGRSINLILWVGVELNEELSKLHSALGARLLAAGFEIDKRPYRPHITLARGDGIKVAAISKFLQNHQHYSTNVFARDLCLYRSETKPEGPVYSVIQHCPLQTDHPTI